MKTFRQLLTEWIDTKIDSSRHPMSQYAELSSSLEKSYHENIPNVRPNVQMMTEHLHSLPDHVTKSIAHYTGYNEDTDTNHSKEINDHLISGGDVSDHEHAKNIASAFDNSPEVNHSFHVWTGVGSKLNITKEREAGATHLHLPAFTSTSIDPRTVQHFAQQKTFPHGIKEVVRIKVPEGSKRIINIQHVSDHPDELEWLVKHGSRVKFTGEINKFKLGDRYFHVHDAELEH